MSCSSPLVAAYCKLVLPLFPSLECLLLAPTCSAEEARALPAVESFDASRIISDDAMLDATTLRASDVDAFLARPHPHASEKPSCLSRMLFGGKTAGQLVEQAAKTYGINPLFLLVQLQKESSLVGYTARVCPAGRLARAFGCGCADRRRCAPQYSGFQNQLDCAASMSRRHLDDLAASGHTVRNWSVDEPKTTFDRLTVTPRNRATAILYTYTPWVGNRYYRGTRPPFGNYLFWQIWGIYAKTLGYRAALAPGGQGDDEQGRDRIR